MLDLVEHAKLRCQPSSMEGIPAQCGDQGCNRSGSSVVSENKPCCCPLDLFKTIDSGDVIWVPGFRGILYLRANKGLVSSGFDFLCTWRQGATQEPESPICLLRDFVAVVIPSQVF